MFFDSEGVPVLNMSDDEFVKGGSEITVTLKVAGEAQEAQPVLEYNFDEDCNGQTAKDSVGDNDATLEGGAVYAQDPDYGQVLYLDGDSSDGWAAMTVIWPSPRASSMAWTASPSPWTSRK